MNLFVRFSNKLFDLFGRHSGRPEQAFSVVNVKHTALAQLNAERGPILLVHFHAVSLTLETKFQRPKRINNFFPGNHSHPQPL